MVTTQEREFDRPGIITLATLGTTTPILLLCSLQTAYANLALAIPGLKSLTYNHGL